MSTPTHHLRAKFTGTGETVLLIHGSGMGPGMWRAYVEPLSRKHRVSAVPLLGYPPSDPIAHGTRDVDALDLAALSELLAGIDGPVHVAAHSYGGFLAARLALAHPGRVKTLALMEPVLFAALWETGDPAGRSELAPFHARESAFWDERTAGGAAWFKPFIDYWNGPGAWEALPEEQRAAFLAVGWKVSQEVFAANHDPRPMSAYRFPMPLLLMRGARTTVAATRVVEHLREQNPSAQVVEVPDVGHMFPITKWRAVVPELEAFFARS